MTPSMLIQALERETADRVAQIERDAEAAVAVVHAEAARRRDRRRQAHLEEVRRRHGERLRRVLVTARAEGRREVLLAREQALERVYQAAAAPLADADVSETWRSGLPSQLALALRYVGDARAVIRCREAIAADVRTAVGDAAVVEASADAEAGFVVEVPNGGVVVDGRLRTRLEQVWPRLAAQALVDLGTPP